MHLRSNINIVQYIKKHFHSKRLALIASNSHYTYQDLDKVTYNIANYLGAHNYDQNSIIAIYMPKSIRSIAAIMGTMRAGLAFWLLDISWPPSYIQQLLQQISPQAIVIDSDATSYFQSSILENISTHIVNFEDCLYPEKKQEILDLAKPNIIAYLSTTSGSSGTPKIVAVPHIAAINCILDCNERLDLENQVYRIGCLSSYAFDASIFEILFALINGYTLCLPKISNPLLGSALASFIKNYCIDLVLLTPTVLSTLPQNTSFPNLKKLIIGGEPCTPMLLKRWLRSGCDIYIAYGTAETAIISTIAKIKHDNEHLKIGKPLKHTFCQILDEKLQPANNNTLGRLYIGGNIGYYYLEASDNNLNFIDLIYNNKKTRFFKTDDIVKLDENSEIIFSHRENYCIKINGVLISPNEIINILSKIKTIYHMVLFQACIKKESHKKIIVAYTTIDKNSIPNSQLFTFIANHLPKYKSPFFFIHITNWPITHSGKVNISKLEKLVKGKISPFKLTLLTTTQNFQSEIVV